MTKQLNSALAGLQVLAEEPSLDPKIKSQFLDLLEKAKRGRPLDTDRWIYRGVVSFLGLAILGSLYFTFNISLKNVDPESAIEMPEIFLAIGSAAVGALAGLLAPRPGGDSTSE